jgi:hypothetical protein
MPLLYAAPVALFRDGDQGKGSGVRLARTCSKIRPENHLQKAVSMDTMLPIIIHDEAGEDVISATGQLNLASGEIFNVVYEDGYDVEVEGLPFKRKDYDFSNGILSNNGKDVEFTIQIDRSGQYCVTADELAEIKIRAAALFSGVQVASLKHKPKGK